MVAEEVRSGERVEDRERGARNEARRHGGKLNRECRTWRSDEAIGLWRLGGRKVEYAPLGVLRIEHWNPAQRG